MLLKKLGMLALLLFLNTTSREVRTGQESADLFAPYEAGVEDGGTSSDQDILSAPAVHRTNAQMAEELAAVGLYLPDDFIKEMDGYDDYEEYKEWYDSYLSTDPAFEYRMLLGSWGWGDYDDNWNWVPTSNQVYAFDCEVTELSGMYTDFMTGVLSISNGEFEITDVVENDDEVDYDEGTGIKVLSFRYNGTPYTFEAVFEHDWIDCEVIRFMNGVFEAEGNPKRLLATGDGGQGCILFYNTEEWGEELEAVTGMRLHTYFY